MMCMENFALHIHIGVIFQESVKRVSCISNSHQTAMYNDN